MKNGAVFLQTQIHLGVHLDTVDKTDPIVSDAPTLRGKGVFFSTGLIDSVRDTYSRTRKVAISRPMFITSPTTIIKCNKLVKFEDATTLVVDTHTHKLML